MCAQILVTCLYLARIWRPAFATGNFVNAPTAFISANLDYPKTRASFARDVQDATSTSDGMLCIFGSHTFVPFSWMCERQTAVSHSSAESEMSTLDAELRMGGLPALQFSDRVVETLASLPTRGINSPASGHSLHQRNEKARNLRC